MIVPGESDGILAEERAITVTIASPRVPGSPQYRLMLRNRAVRAALERFRPDLIECQDAYNLPWAAIAYRSKHPKTALVAVYMTDFPTVYVERPLAKIFGKSVAASLANLCYRYCASLYRRFDAVVALSENGGARKLRSLGIEKVDQVPLGVDLADFGPRLRDPQLRASLGLSKDQPLCLYVGRLDEEKRPDLVVEAFRALPDALGARLALIGEGPLKAKIAALGDERISLPGYLKDRSELARWLASSDIYVSGMADETFGCSIVEAQASGLPVVGVASGAMIDRVTDAVGRLGPAGSPEAMAQNILNVWNSDRTAMAHEAQNKALEFSWDNGMNALFSRNYPLALSRRTEDLPLAYPDAALAT